MTVGVRGPKGGKTRQVRLTRAQISLPVVSSKLETVDGQKLGYVRLADLQRRRRTGAAAGGAQAAAAGRRGAGARPARQRRRPARGGGADREHLPARGRNGRLDRLAHPGPRRLQDQGRQPAVAADRRPDRPQHRLGGGDPHRGAGRRRRREDGRHALLRQGRLPAGDRPLQRRRAEADRRRVLHAGRRPTWPARESTPTCAAPATCRGRARRRGAASGPSGCWRRSEQELPER